MKRPSLPAFELAVVGVVAPLGTGIIASCQRCRRAGVIAEPCAGFGPGCLAPPAPKVDPPPASRR